MSTTTLTLSRPVDAPASEAWEALARFGSIADWNPNLSGSFMLDESPEESGLGALRQCDMSDGKNWIRERVTDWQPGRSYTVDIYEGTMPLKTAEATLSIDDLGDGRSELSMTLTYEPKMGVLGALMNAVMMKSMMKKSIDNLLRGWAESLTAPRAAVA